MRQQLLYRLGNIETKPPDWIVKGVIERDALSCDFGPSGVFKTFRSIDLAACIASDTEYHGHEIKRPGPVVYIAGEGYHGIRRRFRAWELSHGVDLSEAPIYVSKRPVEFGHPDSLQPVTHELNEITESAGAPVLIIIDTLSRNLNGDENSSADMPRFVSAITELKNTYRAAVHVVHHSGHSNAERSRGHSAFRAALEWEWRFEPDPDAHTLRIVCTKSKDAEPPEPMQFEVRGVALDTVDEDGETLTSAILERVEYTPRPKAAKAPRTGNNKATAVTVLSTLVEHARCNVVASGRPATDAGVTLDDWRTACTGGGMRSARFTEAMRSLVKAGTVVQSGVLVSLSADPEPKPTAEPNTSKEVCSAYSAETVEPNSAYSALFGYSAEQGDTESVHGTTGFMGLRPQPDEVSGDAVREALRRAEARR